MATIFSPSNFKLCLQDWSCRTKLHFNINISSNYFVNTGKNPISCIPKKICASKKVTYLKAASSCSVILTLKQKIFQIVPKDKVSQSVTYSRKELSGGGSVCNTNTTTGSNTLKTECFTGAKIFKLKYFRTGESMWGSTETVRGWFSRLEEGEWMKPNKKTVWTMTCVPEHKTVRDK